MSWIGRLVLTGILFLPVVALYLWLAANFRRMDASQRFVLRMFYFLWLFIPIGIFLLAGRGEPGGDPSNQAQQSWPSMGFRIAYCVAIAISPYALWPLAQRLTRKKGKATP